MRVRDLVLIPVIIALVVAGALTDPAFLSAGNLVGLLRQHSELALLVLAEAIILIGGRLDLSLESTVALAPGLAAVLVTTQGVPAAMAIPLCLLIGVLVGAFNGLLVVQFQLSALVATLGMLIVLRGLHFGFTRGGDQLPLPGSFTYLGRAAWLGAPASLWVCGLLFAAGIAFLSFFRYGRAVYAVGGNPHAARAAGIPTAGVLWTALLVGGLIAALAGMLMAGRLDAIEPAQGQGMIFFVLAAAMIGGVSLDGGKGTLFGALCGVLILALLNNVLTLAGVAPQWMQAVYGALIIAALLLTRLTSGGPTA